MDHVYDERRLLMMSNKISINSETPIDEERRDDSKAREAFSYGVAPPRPILEDSVAFLLLAHQVQGFYAYEADLLDQWRYEEWLDLLTEDVKYWAPLRRNVRYGEWDLERTRESADLAYFDEGKTTLELRVKQLLTGLHWAEEPLSRIAHLVTNIALTDVIPSIPAPSEVTVRSRFLVYRNHLEDEENLLIGKKQDVLRRVGAEWKLARRSVFLDQNVLLAGNLNFLF